MICEWCHCETGTKKRHRADYLCRDALLIRVRMIEGWLEQAVENLDEYYITTEEGQALRKAIGSFLDRDMERIGP